MSIQHNMCSGEKTFAHVSLPDAAFIPHVKQRYMAWAALVLGKVILSGLIFGLLLFALAACGSDYHDSVASGSSPGNPTPTPTTSDTNSSKEKATPPPAPDAPPPSLAPPAPYSILYIKEWLARYISAILDGEDDAQVRIQKLRLAYNMLSPDIRVHLSFDSFVNNLEYSLSKDGCWLPGTALVSHPDALTWDIDVAMTNVQCSNYGHANYYASWHFRVQLQQGQLWITSIGLYPTAGAR
jgi:hypothetical protein